MYADSEAQQHYYYHPIIIINQPYLFRKCPSCKFFGNKEKLNEVRDNVKAIHVLKLLQLQSHVSIIQGNYKLN